MKNLPTVLFSLALCTLILTGCTPPPPCSSEVHFPAPSAKRFQATLKTWEGAHISELVASWGEPSHIRQDPGYRYEYSRTTDFIDGVDEFFRGINVGDIKCEVEVWVLEDGTILGIFELADLPSSMPSIIIGILLDTDNPDDCGVTDPWPPRDNPTQPTRERIDVRYRSENLCIDNTGSVILSIHY